MRENPKEQIQEILDIVGSSRTRHVFYHEPARFDRLFPSQYRKMEKFPGGSFHRFDPANHCFICATLMRAGTEVWKKLAALLHDVGKADIRSEECDLETREEEIHYYRHEFVGAEIAQKWFESFGLQNWEDAGIPVAKVVGLIRWHMFDMLAVNETRVKRWLEEFNEDWIYDLFDLRLADWGAAKTTPVEQEDIERVRVRAMTWIIKLKDDAAHLAHLKATGKYPLAIKSTDLMELGVKPGPFFGALLKHLQAMVNNDDIENTKEALTAAVKSQMAQP